MLIEHSGRPEILDRVEALGFPVFNSSDFDINIIGERNPNGEANKFDDWIHLLYLEGGVWKWHAYKATTDAGRHYLESSDTAILVHNRQYRGAYVLGLHRGKYEALVQRGAEVTIWRDRNRDDSHDFGGEEISGYFGINIHRASATHESQSVDRYSAGCQVIADPSDFEDFISRCKLQIQHLRFERFTYTLILGR